jgi:tetratricopeptide (TPR) repeat protein
LERGEGGNRDLAFRDYPQVMNKAKIVTTYWLRYIPVDIYRIGEWTGNPKTEAYPLSDFEKAGLMMEKGSTDSALALLEDFIDQHPENYSGYKAITEIYYDMGEYEKAALTLEKAAQFNPTDFVIHQQLGAVYITLAIETDRDSYRLMAIEQWEESLKLFPQNTELAEKLKILKEF